MTASCKSAPARSRFRVWLVLAVIGVPFAAGAKPQHGQTFKDWTARCEESPGSAVERCFIFQNLVLKGEVQVLQRQTFHL